MVRIRTPFWVAVDSDQKEDEDIKQLAEKEPVKAKQTIVSHPQARVLCQLFTKLFQQRQL